MLHHASLSKRSELYSLDTVVHSYEMKKQECCLSVSVGDPVRLTIFAHTGLNPLQVESTTRAAFVASWELPPTVIPAFVSLH